MICSWVVSDLFSTCLCLAHNTDLFTTSLCLAHNLFMHNLLKICLWLVHELFITCSLLVHNLFITYSKLVRTLFVTCSWVVNELFITFSLLVAKLSSSSSLVELSTALILIISTHPHPQDSSNEALLDYLERWNLVWKLNSTKIGKLANKLAPS